MSSIKVLIYHCINNKIKKFPGFHKLIRRWKLAVSNEEILIHKVIGLDEHKKKLVIVRKTAAVPLCCIIDLNEVQSCSVKKMYGSISAGSLKRKNLNQYLHSISLHLGFKSGKAPVVLKFYEDAFNKPDESVALEEKAKKWERLVSGLIVKERA